MKSLIVFVLEFVLVSSKSFLTSKNFLPPMPQTCDNLIPQKDVDWTKLVGDWHHLMYIPEVSNTFVSCRDMKVTNVDSVKKELDFDFTFRTYEGYGKSTHGDTIFYRWFETPGVIHTAIKFDTISKAPSKLALRKKNAMAQLKKSSASKFTVVGTDHENYIILTQCRRYGPPFVWVSLKSTTPDSEIFEEVRVKMSSLGINTQGLYLNSETICMP